MDENKLFDGKILLVTGGTGSFGNAVTKRFLRTGIKEIRIVSRDEKKQDDMRHEYQAKYPEYAEKIIRFFMPISKSGDIWNVNFPSSKLGIKGIKVTPLGRHEYTDRYVKVNEEEYILKGTPLDRLDDEDCDIVWGQKGYVTVTPILFNKTNYRKIEEVKDKCERLL